MAASKDKKPENEELDFNALIPKKQSLDVIAKKIIQEKDALKLNPILDEFRIVTLKKELIRLVKLQEFSDLADTEVGRRLKTNPERIKNSELIEFSKLIQDSIDRVNKQVDNIRETTNLFTGVKSVSLTKNETNIFNFNVASREKVRTAVEEMINVIDSAPEVTEILTVSDPPEMEVSEAVAKDEPIAEEDSEIKLKGDED